MSKPNDRQANPLHPLAWWGLWGGLALAMQSGSSWWDLGFLAVLAFIVHSRWDMLRLREAMRLFEDRGPQKVQEI